MATTTIGPKVSVAPAAIPFAKTPHGLLNAALSKLAEDGKLDTGFLSNISGKPGPFSEASDLVKAARNAIAVADQPMELYQLINDVVSDLQPTNLPATTAMMQGLYQAAKQRQSTLDASSKGWTPPG